MSPGAWRGLSRQLRALNLSRTSVDARTVRVLVDYGVNLVELNLEHTSLPGSVSNVLLRRPPPPELVCLSLRGSTITGDHAQMILQHYGERVLL